MRACTANCACDTDLRWYLLACGKHLLLTRSKKKFRFPWFCFQPDLSLPSKLGHRLCASFGPLAF